MDKNETIASNVLQAVGGKENVTSAMHCMTRLRLTLKDKSVTTPEELKKIDGVIGAQFVGDQLQIIIGPNVTKVYDAFVDMGGLQHEAAIDENLDGEKKSVVDRIFGYISGSMTPILSALIAAGMLKMIVAVLGPSALNLINENSDIYVLLTFLGDAGMYFLPVFLAVSASKKLNTSWPINVYLAVAMLHPTFMAMATNGTPFTVFGIPCSVQNYSSQVLPILIIVYIESKIEKFVKKYCPDTLQILLVPLVTILIMTPIAFCVVGPAGSFLSNYICGGIIKLYDIAGPLATMLIGAFFLPIVFTGMHGMLYVYLFTSFPALGYDAFFLPAVLASSWTILGCWLGCLIKFKKKENKAFATTAFISWIAGGVGEPFMYGILMKNKKLLIASCCAGGIAGLVAGLLHLTAHVLAPSNGIYGLFAFLGGSPMNYAALVITVLVSAGCALAATLIIGVDED